MNSNRDDIELFMTRTFEKNVNELILSDKNFIVPKQKVHEYIDRVLSVPYINYIGYARIHKGIVDDEQLTQSSNFSACSSEMCKAMEKMGNPGLKFIDIGQLFPQFIKQKNEVAFRKYGENQVKTSSQLGLTFEYYGYWYLTCLGYVYNELDKNQQDSLFARTVLRIPLYQNILLRLLDGDVFLSDYMRKMALSTQGRRAGSIMKLLDFCLGECRNARILYHDLYYPIYVSKSKTVRYAISPGTFPLSR